jgi:nickel-dependent lactate racemase
VIAGKGGPELNLSLDEARELLEKGTPKELVEGKRVLVLTPDATRTCPLPLMITALADTIGGRVARLDFMVSLGSHTPMSEEQILSLYGISTERRAREFSRSRFMNHRWDLEGTLTPLGTIGAAEIEELTGGLFREEVTVDLNRTALEYDLIFVLGPVFPHEVVGISGGEKYLFPGISGGEFLHFFHWVGAVITCWETIGYKDTPVRRLVERAARMVPVPRHFACMVVGHAPPESAPGVGGAATGGRATSGDGVGEAAGTGRAARPGSSVEPGPPTLAGLFVGDREAWSAAADLSARLHIEYKDRPYHTVVGRAAPMYDELWVGAKVMYKLEPVVADGGRLIIYGPHMRDISRTWGDRLERIGYHVRDYFLAQMDRFLDVPRGVLAHSTHVKGLGTYQDGVERPRIEVILATGISEELCRRVNLGYLDPASVRVEDYQGREGEGVLFVDHAGEILHRLKGDSR